jgi:glycosyltransferase involved in cell wall biosynthesis
LLIAYDYQIFAAQKFGGISRYFCALAAHLALLPRVKSKIIAPLYTNNHLKTSPKDIVIGMFVPRLRRTERALGVLNSLIFPGVVRMLRPDIVHETYYSAAPTSRRTCPRVITVFDMIHELWPDSFPETDRTRTLKRSAIERADHVICISENTRRDLLSAFRIPEERVSVTHLGFDRLKPGPVSAADLVGNSPYLLYVGVRNKYKNFTGFARAFATSPWLLNNCRMVCFGGGAFTIDERAALEKLGLNDSKVVQIGGGDGTLAALYAGAAAFVYPSLYEGFGIPPLEAMSLGCPVVTSNAGSIPEVVGDAAEYCNPLDSDSIRDAMETTLRSEEHRRTLVARGRTRCAIFSWERCASETLSVYERVAS